MEYGDLQGLCVPIQCPPGYEPGALPLRHFNEISKGNLCV
jgi:hypothetical protein